jgi:hypothetical protein
VAETFEEKAGDQKKRIDWPYGPEKDLVEAMDEDG